MKLRLLKVFCSMVLVGTLVLAFTTIVFASGSGMPWESPIQRITDSITGPVAKCIGIIMIIGACFGFAKSEHGEMLKTFFGICIALSTAFSAATFVLPFLGFSGGVGF